MIDNPNSNVIFTGNASQDLLSYAGSLLYMNKVLINIHLFTEISRSSLKLRTPSLAVKRYKISQMILKN